MFFPTNSMMYLPLDQFFFFVFYTLVKSMVMPQLDNSHSVNDISDKFNLFRSKSIIGCKACTKKRSYHFTLKSYKNQLLKICFALRIKLFKFTICLVLATPVESLNPFFVSSSITFFKNSEYL